MHYLRHLKYILLVTGVLSLSLSANNGSTLANSKIAPDKISQSLTQIGNNSCLSCHAANQPQIGTIVSNANKRQHTGIQNDQFLNSVHGELACIECHKEITDNNANHQLNNLKKPNCVSCHINLSQAINKQVTNTDKARLEVVILNIESYKQSLHALSDNNAGVKAFCEDCHNTHYFNIPPQGTSEHNDWRLTIPNVCGTSCHADILKTYTESIHGVEVIEKNNPKSAVCIDCHTSHNITKTTRDPFQLSVTRQCGSCHQNNFATYRDTYHGQINTLGYTYTAKCYNCHGSHQILGVDDPNSSIHISNRLETCEQCHDGIRATIAKSGFLTFSPHANSHDYERYPEVWLAAKFMHGLLLFVFSYFWIHSLLWWYREYKNRRHASNSIHIKTDELVQEEPKQVQRFSLAWRIGHLLFALSVMSLILTGMSVFYAYTAWAPVVVDILGGPQKVGLIHRISATVMLSIFFLHLIGVSVNIYRSRQTFRWFGPDSLMPNWKDLRDTRDMFKWFFDKGPRPIFDRWTYWEKFDYWAVFWGLAVIASSGMILSFPGITATFFPGWIFNVVMLVHGEEAFMAAVFLFTVHFFNNHFRPDKLPPPDIVMFTGTQSLEEFKRDHRMQYDRLVETGELEKYLVDVPSKPMTIGSKILGLVLITCGLALLVVVATGFFGDYTE